MHVALWVGLLRIDLLLGCFNDAQLAASYYAAFTRFAHAPRGPRGLLPAAADVGLEPATMLPTLYEIRECQTQASARTEDSAAAVISTQEVTPASDGIDCDAVPQGQGDARVVGDIEGINWDIAVGVEDMAAAGSNAAGGGGGVDINWDIDMTEEAAAVDVASSTAPTPIAIDWDIEIDTVGDAAATDVDNTLVDVEDRDPATSAPLAAAEVMDADDVAAARLERDGEYRARLHDDLLELRAFLAQVRVMNHRWTLNTGDGSSFLAVYDYTTQLLPLALTSVLWRGLWRGF